MDRKQSVKRGVWYIGGRRRRQRVLKGGIFTNSWPTQIWYNSTDQ